jgi:hypothetical protein
LKRFEKIIEGLRNKSPLPLLYENGYTPETIKSELLNDFEPYFSDKQSLEKYALKYMVADWINFMRVGILYPGIHSDIKKLLETYEKAKQTDKNMTIQVLSELMPYHVESGNKFWSFVNLEVPKSDLEIEEFVQTSMKDISDIIEGISKVLYVEQVAINRIIRKKPFDVKKIIENKLGSNIQEIIDCSLNKELFVIEPEKIKISDWRNISAHLTYTINKDKIILEYGEKENKKSFITDRKGLFDRVQKIMRTTEALSLAHKFFGFDNMDSIRKIVKKDESDARDEMGFLVFSSGIMSQGFEIVHIDYKNKDYAVLELQDLTEDDPIKRGIHASQFLINLWVLTNKSRLEVKYKTKKGQTFMVSKCDGDTCELVCTNEKDFSYLAEKVEFETINNGG